MNQRWVEEFDAFYSEHYGRLAGALRLACGGDAHAGEDFAQEAMVRAWTKWVRVRELDHPAGWVFMTGFNLVKRRGRVRRALPWTRPIFTDATADVDNKLTIERALLFLTDQQRAAVITRFILGMSTDEAATTLGISAEALRSTLHRGVASLRASRGLVDGAVQ